MIWRRQSCCQYQRLWHLPGCLCNWYYVFNLLVAPSGMSLQLVLCLQLACGTFRDVSATGIMSSTCLWHLPGCLCNWYYVFNLPVAPSGMSLQLVLCLQLACGTFRDVSATGIMSSTCLWHLPGCLCNWYYVFNLPVAPSGMSLQLVLCLQLACGTFRDVSATGIMSSTCLWHFPGCLCNWYYVFNLPVAPSGMSLQLVLSSTSP